MRRHVRWLYGELPELVREEVLDENAAQRLRSYYEPFADPRPPYGLIAFGLLGALLIGAGIALLFAHNWPLWGRSAHLTAAFSPVVLSQLLVLWVLFFRRQRAYLWTEGSGALLVLTLGACIALIGQTYHAAGSLADFLWLWMLLSLPLTYLLRSLTVALIYLAGITLWAFAAQEYGNHALGFWLLLIGVLPYYMMLLVRDRHSARASTLGWALCLCLTVATAFTLERTVPGLWLIVYTALFSCFFLTDAYRLSPADGHRFRPLQVFGVLGLAGLALLTTWGWTWEGIGWRHARIGWGFTESGNIHDHVLSGLLLTAALLLIAYGWRRLGWHRLALAALPVLVAAAFALITLGLAPIYVVWLFNLYVLAVGVLVLLEAMRRNSIMLLNAGLSLLFVLIAARFFDAGLSFLERGIAFVILGLMFLIANLMARRRLAGTPTA